MPKRAAPSPLKYQLKHRLAGAVIVVAAAVLVIPLLLSEEVGNGHLDLGGANYAQTHAGLKPATAEQPASRGDADAGKTPEKKTRQALVALTNNDQNTARIPDKTDKTTAIKTAAEKTATRPATPATASSGWDVRAGTFTKLAGIDAVSALLESHGYRVNKTSVNTSLDGKATRIWLGPYAKRQTAEAVALRMKTILRGEKGYVVEHAP